MNPPGLLALIHTLIANTIVLNIKHEEISLRKKPQINFGNMKFVLVFKHEHYILADAKLIIVIFLLNFFCVLSRVLAVIYLMIEDELQ